MRLAGAAIEQGNRLRKKFGGAARIPFKWRPQGPCMRPAKGRAAAAVDLFCGAGGLSCGLQQAGIRICAGIDADPSCRYPFEANIGAPFHGMDARDISAKFLRSCYPPGSVRILAGCAPCQPFSCYSRTGNGDRWTLLTRFAELVKSVKPGIVTMENVPGLERHPVFGRFTGALDGAGYRRWHGIVDCSRYGVPQTRRRLVLLASRLGDIGPMAPERAGRGRATVSDAISHMVPIAAGSASRRDRLHRSSSMSGLNLERIKRSKPGGTWEDWDPRLRAGCHRRDAGATYSAVYGRMSWNRPGPTITTQFNGFGSGRFGHPEQDRALSLREGALLQTFPAKYKFVPRGEEVKIRNVARMIGNAVPVKLGRAIGACIAGHLVKHDG